MRNAVHEYEVTNSGKRLMNALFCLSDKIDYKVSEPPEPGDIIWENLNLHIVDRLCRQMITTSLGGILIMGCFFSILLIKVLKTAFLNAKDEEAEELGNFDSDGHVIYDESTLFQLQVFSASVALVITLANWISKIILTKFAAYRREETYSKQIY